MLLLEFLIVVVYADSWLDYLNSHQIYKQSRKIFRYYQKKKTQQTFVLIIDKGQAADTDAAATPLTR